MATRKIYSLYLCLDGLVSKGVLCPSFKNVSLEDIDQSTTHFSDVFDFISKSGMKYDRGRKYSLIIMSSGGSKLDVLFSSDREFYEKEVNEKTRMQYGHDLLDLLYKYLFSSSDNKRIKESPIFMHFRNVLKKYSNSNGEVDFVHLSYDILNWGFGRVRSKAISSYRSMRDIYIYLKANGLIKVSTTNINGQVNDRADYYLYVINKSVSYDPNDFFKNKILCYSGSLKDIDKYTFTHKEIVDGRIFSHSEREKFISDGRNVGSKVGLDVLLNSSDNQVFYDSEVLGNKDSKMDLYYQLNLYFPMASTNSSFIRFFDQNYYDNMVKVNSKLDRNYLINEWWGNLDFDKLSYMEIRGIYFAIMNAVREVYLGSSSGKRRKRV